MSSDLFTRARELFLAACERTPETRARFLDEACAEDAALREEVEVLLRFHDMERLSTGEFLRPTAAPADVPETIGDYRLLRKLGEGGMGVVYEAEQRGPIQRRVALKLIKWGLDTKEVLGRFEAERQALALMTHPNIARVFDAGATAAGRPFFVMELVPGVPLTEYCDAHRLTTRERLELVVQVCQGAHHAHQKGIIHRDLKPSNVLVAEEDGVPVPKIIDFGVAKATRQRLAERTVLTELGQWIGTPEYVSPEQADLTALDVDIRTDVYSLGVMLYELLVGVPPLDPGALRGAGFDGMRRLIREQEPPRPSSRVSRLGADSQAGAGRRRTDVSRWVLELRGDLDWIVMKALEKDRARRYGSATELGSDVSRHLRDEPVLARPPSTLYRLGKFVRRHRAGVAAGALVTAALLAGLAFATLGMVRARRAERLARTQVELLVAMIDSLDPNSGPGSGARPEELLATLARRIDAELSERPLVRSRLLLSMARIYQNLEAHEEARSLFEEALRVQVQQKLSDSEPAVVAFTLRSLGDLEGVMGDYASARRHLEQALAIAERHLGPEHDTAVASLADLAMVSWRNGEYLEARDLAERAVALREKSAGADDLLLAYSLFVRGVALHDLGELEAARETLERSLGIRERRLGLDATEVAWALDRLGLVFLAKGEWERATELLERAVRIQEARFGPESFALIEPLSGLGHVRLSLGDPSGAERLFQRALHLQERLFGPDHHYVAWSLDSLGRAAEASGDGGRAREHFERALRLREQAFGPEHRFVATSLAWLGRMAFSQGDDARALSLLERRSRILEAGPTPSPFWLSWARVDVARVRARMGDRLEARRLYDLARSAAEGGVAREGIASARYYLELGCLAALVGDADEALTWLRQAVSRGLPPPELLRRRELAPLRARPDFRDWIAAHEQRPHDAPPQGQR